MVLSQVLLFIYTFNVGFHCGYDTVVRQRVSTYITNPLKGPFNAECEMLTCIVKTYNLFDNDKFIEDGYLTMAAINTEYNSTVIYEVKKELDKCLPQINQKITNVAKKCDKIQRGSKLLLECLDLSKFPFLSQVSGIN